MLFLSTWRLSAGLHSCNRGRHVSSPATQPAPSRSCSSEPRRIAVHAAKGFGPAKPASQAKKADAGIKELDGKARCPCGSGSTYEACCRPFHYSSQSAQSPEQLLRSRYSAYSTRNAPYIADTTHIDAKEYSGTRSTYISQVTKSMKRMDCRSLQVLEQQPGATEQEHFITFKLTFCDRAEEEPELQTRTEKSRFRKEGSKWFFMDSEFIKE